MKCFTKQGTVLVIIIIHWFLKRNTKQSKEQDLKANASNISIALAKVKAGNYSENLLNEIRQIVYSLYQSKEITKKVYNNIIKSMQKRLLNL